MPLLKSIRDFAGHLVAAVAFGFCCGAALGGCIVGFALVMRLAGY